MTPGLAEIPPPVPNSSTVRGKTFTRIAEGAQLFRRSAAWVLSELVDEIDLHVSWEVDEECLKVLRCHHPRVQCRGDFLNDPEAGCRRHQSA